MRRTILSSILLLSSAIALAQSGSPEALYDRGVDAITGIGSTQNDSLGVDYFRRSADLGYGPAQIALAYYYETGTVLASNPGLAADLYRKAAQQGDPLDGWLAGRIYFLGNGVPRDPDAALKWLKLSADQNNAYGSYYLGRLMADRDFTKAPKLYKIAADQGLPQAQYFYAKALKDAAALRRIALPPMSGTPLRPTRVMQPPTRILANSTAVILRPIRSRKREQKPATWNKS